MILIITFAIITIIAMGLVGYIYADSKKWKYIDPVYYLFGVIGIISIFILKENERLTLDYKKQSYELRQKISNIEYKKPRIQKHFIDNTYLEIKINWLDKIIDWEESCGKTIYPNPACKTVNDLAPIVKKFRSGFKSNYLNEKEINESIMYLCSSSKKMIDEIKKSGVISNVIIDSLEKTLKKGIEEGVNIYDHENYGKITNDFITEAENEAQKMLARLGNEHLELMKEKYKIDIMLSTAILNSIKICAEVPKKIRDGTFSKWKNELDSAASELTELEKEIMEIDSKDKDPSIFNFFNLLFWPYILIFAVSLKFGRSIGELRKKYRT